MPSLSTLGQYTTAPKRCVLRVLTAVAPLGAMNMYITLGVGSGYGRGTARPTCGGPCRLQGLLPCSVHGTVCVGACAKVGL